ncbi:MAG: DMT family transporter [Pyramidobacter sp.]|nr:DMT family transporter [Pyramidobacter sp.]
MNAVGLIYCLIALFFWGVAPVIYRFCGDTVSPKKMQGLRAVGFILTSILLLAVDRGKFWGGGLDTLCLMLSTVLGVAVGDTLYFKSISKIGAGKAAALTSTYPLYTVFLSWLLMGEGLSIWGVLGVVSVVAGLMLLCLFREQNAGSGYGNQPVRKGLLTGIGAGLCWGIGLVVIRWVTVRTGISAASVTFWRALAVFLTTWPAYLRERRELGTSEPLVDFKDKKSFLMVGAGVFVLALPSWFVSQALSHIPAAMVTPITGSSPVVAALLGFFFFREKISPLQWLGIVMIIGGGIVINVL